MARLVLTAARVSQVYRTKLRLKSVFSPTPPYRKAAWRILFSTCPCLRPISYKPLVGIAANLQLWCSWAQRWTDYVLRSEVKGQGHSKNSDQISTSGLGGMFSPAPGIQGHIGMKLIIGSTWHWWHFQGQGFKVKVTDNIFEKLTFPAEVYTYRRFAIE